jgi:hypothetical protein
MAKLMSKSELIQKIAEQHENSITRKDVKGVIESLAKDSLVIFWPTAMAIVLVFVIVFILSTR